MQRPFFSILLTAVIMSIMLSGCVYMNVRAPLDTDVARTQLGSKVAKSTSQSIMWLFAWGDSGVEAAAAQGELETINHLDVEYFLILFGVYAERTTIAYGD
jgi:hypothetical protein